MLGPRREEVEMSRLRELLKETEGRLSLEVGRHRSPRLASILTTNYDESWLIVEVS